MIGSTQWGGDTNPSEVPSLDPNLQPKRPSSHVGYLWVPHLQLAVALWEHAELGGPQVVVVRGGAGSELVVDASEECQAAGVRIGRPLREAREYCPDTRVLSANPDSERRAHEDLLDLVGMVAPQVEGDGLGRAYFTPDRPINREEARWLLATLRVLVWERLTLRTRLALAPVKFAARTAAERDLEADTGTPIVPDGEVPAYLAPLPVDALPLPSRAVERLRLLGISTIGQFARLPKNSLARRFGPEAVAAHRLAHGQDDRPVVPRSSPDVRSARHPFDPPVDTQEPLLAVAWGLLERLCQGVRDDGKAFRTLGVVVEGEFGDPVERAAQLRLATATPELCRATLHTLVSAAAHAEPVAAVSVTLSGLCPIRVEQPALFEDAAGRAERGNRLRSAVKEVGRRYPARLRRVAPSQIPTLLDEHRFALLPYEPSDEEQPAPPEVPPAGLRRVRVERVGGRPHLVETGRRDELGAVCGCWRAEEWWPTEVSRVYWRVRTRSRRVVTLSRDAEGWRLVEVMD